MEFWRIGWIGVVVGGAAAVGSGLGFAGVVVGAAVVGVLSSCLLCFLASLFFGDCGWLGGLVLLVMLVLFVGGWVD